MADKALKGQETKELDSKKEQQDFPDDLDLITKNEKRLAEINKITIYKKIVKMEKSGRKKNILVSEDLKGKSGKELKELNEKIEKMINMYRNINKKLMKQSKKLAEFSEKTAVEEPADYHIYELTLKTIMILKNFQNTYSSFITELLYKKQEIKIYRQKRKIKKLEKTVFGKKIK